MVLIYALGVSQIAYFCAEHLIFWVHKCAKGVHTEEDAFVTQYRPKIERATMDTSDIVEVA